MSEAVETSQHGDVVSSVRRLVSPEPRPRVVSTGQRMECLILTPAFRVPADDAGTRPPAAERPANPDSEPTPAPALPEAVAKTRDDSLSKEAAWTAEPSGVVRGTEPSDSAVAADAGQPSPASPAEKPEASVLPFPLSGMTVATSMQPDPAPTDAVMEGGAGPETLLDELALADIIRTLIREELQGTLGERITHGVRKLVRAEIKRALAAHDLD